MTAKAEVGKVAVTPKTNAAGVTLEEILEVYKFFPARFNYRFWAQWLPLVGTETEAEITKLWKANDIRSAGFVPPIPVQYTALTFPYGMMDTPIRFINGEYHMITGTKVTPGGDFQVRADGKWTTGWVSGAVWATGVPMGYVAP